MIKIYGTAISNYHNTAKLALIEKGVEFDEIDQFPGQDEKILAASPMGKVPWIEVDGKPLSEVNVIFDYLEDTCPNPPMYPQVPWERAKAKEIIRVVELYCDAAARRHISTVYFGADVDQTAFDEVRPALENGLRAFKQLARFSPYVAGSDFGFADIATFFQLQFTNLHTRKIYDWDFIAEDSALSDYFAMLSERPSLREVNGVMQAAMTKVLPQ